MSYHPSDISIYDSLGFSSSTWRNGGGAPDYTTYKPSSNVYYTGEPYTPEGITDPDATYNFSVDVSSIYGEVFWDTFFQTLFPQIYTENFLHEQSTGTPGGYFTQLYEVAMRDFYDSFFRARDDLGSTLGNEVLTHNFSVPEDGDDYKYWNSLSYDEQRLIIKKYLFSRTTNLAEQSYFASNTEDADMLVYRNFTDNIFLKNLNLRVTNVFFYVASLMIRVMESLQENTINASNYTTLLADTQQSISKQMTSSQYNYISLNSSSDYITMQKNSQNSLALENLRQFRDQIQKQTDRASSFLQTTQDSVEQQGSKALEFLKKSQQLNQLFFKSM